MTRSYTLSEQPFEIERGAELGELELERRWADTLARHWPGLSGIWTEVGDRIRLPWLRELRFDGRALRGDEYSRARDLLEAFAEAAGGRVHWWIEEMFALDFFAIERPEMLELERAYATLPGWAPEARAETAEYPLPRWFGDPDGPAPWLSGSVEPPGLQVFGVLPLEAWSEWKRQFLEATAALPHRDL